MIRLKIYYAVDKPFSVILHYLRNQGHFIEVCILRFYQRLSEKQLKIDFISLHLYRNLVKKSCGLRSGHL